MRPLLLVLQAVGPYPGRHRVDFRAVLDSGLFGIYGATGSGKSTIFSAMTFALFGEAARSEQPASTLRSDHADLNLLTEVELVFEVGEHTYRIVRQPEQMRPARRGSGETKEPHKAWLFDVTGLDLDRLGETNPGKVIAETKVRAVDEAIVRLLGYGSAQFRQIVLLPQGRFEAFLSADTQERLKILRDLFDVSLYRRLTERVRAEADAAEKTIATARAVSIGRLTAESFASIEALSEGIAEAALQLSGLREAAGKAKAERDAALQTYQQAAETNAAFLEHRDAEEALARIERAAPEIDALGQRLQVARRVQSLAGAAASLAKARLASVEADAREKQALSRLAAAERQACSAAASLGAVLARAAEIEKHKATLQIFRGYEAQIETAEGLRAKALAAERAARAAKAAASEAKSALDRLGRRRDEVARALEAAQQSEIERARLDAELTRLKQRHRDAAAYEAALERAREARSAAQAASADEAATSEILRRAEAAFEQAEAALLKNHAAHLARHLKPGKDCPVCGSREHPAPAVASAHDQAAGDRYEELKAALARARSLASEARTTAGIAARLAAERHADVAALAAPGSTAADVAAALRKAAADMERVASAATVEDLRSALCKIDEDLPAAARTLEDAQQKHAEASNAAAAAEQAVVSALAAIPADLRLQDALAAAIAGLVGAISRYEEERDRAAMADREAATRRAAAEKERETIAAECARSSERAAEEEAGFAARLTALGLTPVEYESRKADEASIPAFEASIRAYTEQRAAAADRLRRAANAVAGLVPPDLAALASARDEAAAIYDRVQDTATRAAARLSHLETLQSQLAAEARRLDRLEKDTAPVRELAEAFAGKTYNKVDLETFAISTLFDRVLEAANLRLSPMTRGRYALVREVEGRGNARRGLGIAVEDTYTGRQRPTSTLSGGETFIAALALALGLSDVVESAHGSVRLDTIFIDEGFGSLDSDSDSGTLETVLQTLQEIVGATRSVGVISHVPLVQQAIPTGFFVTKTPGGSHIELRL